MLTLALFNQPIRAHSPCGENLEYDPAFVALEALLAGRGEQQFGKTILEAQGPDWPLIWQQSLQLASQTKDLRIYVYLAHAALVTQGIGAFALCLQGITQACELYWPDLHPKEDWQEDGDPTFRINTLQALSNGDCLKYVRSLRLLSSSFLGEVSWRKLAILTHQLEAKGDEDKVDEPALLRIFNEVGFEAVERLHQDCQQVLQAYNGLKKCLDQAVGIENSINLQIIKKEWQAVAQYIAQRYNELKGEEPSLDTPTDVSESSIPAEGGAMVSSPPIKVSGPISSRADVLKSLKELCDYYQKHEPSSPIPLLLERAIRLVPMSFAEILQDMCSDGLPQAERLAGVALAAKK